MGIEKEWNEPQSQKLNVQKDMNGKERRKNNHFTSIPSMKCITQNYDYY